MSLYPGRRLCYDNALCTVRFHGTLERTKGDWLGVEWDDTSRGKHNGQHQGEQIFECLSPSAHAASFIRPTRKHDSNRTILQAIEHKYASSSATNGTALPGTQSLIEISGKTVEEVGFEKIQTQISRLSDLKVALVDELNVTAVAREKDDLQDAQAQLGEICPNISELDIGWNAIETWQDVADICTPFRKLRTLKASGLRLRGFEAAMLSDTISPFSSVTELHLNECLLTPDQILKLLSCSGKALFPSLKTLWLSQNNLISFQTNSELRFESVTSLVMENNKFDTLDPLLAVFDHFPNATHLSLQGNQITSIGTSLSGSTFSTLQSLNIAGNSISNFSFTDTLPTLFPNLTSLRISKNPLYDQPSTATTETSTTTTSTDSTYYLTLARIPSLKTLNYTTITTRDREEGEIYYLSVTEKHIHQLLSSSSKSTTSVQQLAQQTHPLYSTLCEKYDRPNILLSPPPTPVATSTQSYKPNTLGARLINTTFYIPTTPEPQSLTRPLPPSTSVFTLKSLLSRHFGLRPLSFALIWETGELDPVHETTTKLGRGRAGWAEWGDWDVDVSSTTSVENADGEEPVEKWVDGYLQRDGVQWRRREIEILDGMRGWGDFLESDVREATVRIEPVRDWEGERGRWKKKDLWDVVGR